MTHPGGAGSGAQAFSLDEKIAPWVIFASQHDRFMVDHLTELNKRGVIIKYLDAEKMDNPVALFRTFAQTFKFPAYFGHNWDALVDCLDDLHGDWHGNADVTAVIERGHLILRSPHFPLFVSVLCQAAERANSAVDLDGDLLDRPAIALHFVFMIEDGDVDELARTLKVSERMVVRNGNYITVE